MSSQSWLWKQLKTVSAAVCMFLVSFFIRFVLVWILFNLPLPAFVCFPRCVVYLSLCFLYPTLLCSRVLHATRFVLWSFEFVLSFVFLFSCPFFYLWILDFELLDISLSSKLTFCYPTCLPASVSVFVTGFIASNKNISLLLNFFAWVFARDKDTVLTGEMTAATAIYNSFGRHRWKSFSCSSIISTNWLLNVVVEVKNDPCI